MKTTLVIMAAGMGSRFGGIKQMQPVGLYGEFIADYSVYDARRAGFDKVIFVIKKELETAFHETIFTRISKEIEAECVFQELDALPLGYTPRTGRTKPWGTGHAVLCCAGQVKENFAVINADDFYGPETFVQLHKHLTDPKHLETLRNYCMVGFQLKNTVTEHGTVSRGVCTVNERGELENVEERVKIAKTEDGIIYYEGNEKTLLPDDTIVSMNAWGFTPSFFETLQEGFIQFLEKGGKELSTEFYLPEQVKQAIADKKHPAVVSVLPCQEKWYGITYQEDIPTLCSAIRQMAAVGKYPHKLWR